MSLGSTQREFTLLISDLIQWAYQNGYELTFGDAYRDPRSHGAVGEQGVYGHKNSNHKNRLAVDLNLFKDGVYQQRTEDYNEVGKKWETMHMLARWGGRFADGNHFSFEYGGMK